MKFTIFQRKHHCRKCGEIFCDPHSRTTLRLHPITLQFTDNASFPLVRGCPMCHTKYEEWLMRKRNRENSVRSDCLGGESVGVLIRKSTQNDDKNGNWDFEYTVSWPVKHLVGLPRQAFQRIGVGQRSNPTPVLFRFPLVIPSLSLPSSLSSIYTIANYFLGGLLIYGSEEIVMRAGYVHTLSGATIWRGDTIEHYIYIYYKILQLLVWMRYWLSLAVRVFFGSGLGFGGDSAFCL